jgi:hypothetical protein
MHVLSARVKTNGKSPVSAHVILVHDDSAFLDLLTAALKEAGYEVEAFSDPRTVVPPPRGMDRLEITVSRAAPPYPGLRIRVTGFAATKPYAGHLGQFLAEPVTAQDVVKALRQFVAD